MGIAELEAKGGELIRTPSGQGCWYFDEDHSYWRAKEDGGRGKRLTGATTVIKPIDFEKDNLMKWAAKLNTIGVSRLVDAALQADDVEAARTDLHWLLSEDPDEIWDALTAASLTYEDIREEKAQIGTNIHRIVLQALAEGEPVPDFAALRDDEHGYAEAVTDFWLDHNPEVEQCEQVVVDDDLGIAGRFDLRARFAPCEDILCPCQNGGIGLVDLKTSSFIGEKDHVQVALYAHLAEVSGFGGTDWTGVLHVAEDGSYRLWEGLAPRQMALDCVRVYRCRGEIRSGAGKQRKARCSS